jgi:hypothetical protein
MKHVLYNMQGAAPAPAGDGDTKSWFEYYKWDVDGEVFVPVQDTRAKEGDVLWFAMDGDIIGCAIVLRLFQSVLSQNGGWEIWYRGDRIYKAVKRADVAMISEEILPQEQGDAWLNDILEKNPLAN